MTTYTPTRDEVDRMRKETGAGMIHCKEALVTARGDWEDAKQFLRYLGTTRLGGFLRQLEAKHKDTP